MHTLTTLTEAISDCEKSRAAGINYITGLHKEEFISYAELKVRSLKLLSFLGHHGLPAFEEVVIFTKENKYLVDSFFACIFGGKIAAPVSGSNKLDNVKKLELILGKMNNPMLVVESGLEEGIQAFIADNASCNMAKTKTVFIQESHYLECEQAPIAKVSSDDIAFIQFSSGSTSSPKGVTLTHRNVLSNVNSLCNNSKFQAHEEMVSWMPLTHDMGMIGSLICMVVFKYNTHIISTELFSRRPIVWLDACSRKKATITMSPNFGYKHVIKCVDDAKLKGMDFSSIRRLYNGAEPISIDLCHEFMAKLAPHGLNPDSMLMVYGLAEATLSVTMAEIMEPFEYLSVKRSSLQIEEKVECATSPEDKGLAFPSVGKSVIYCNVRVASPNTDTPLADYEIGEIQISGAGVMSGYYNDPEISAQSFSQDGWFKTGDLGFLDSSQRLFITGRLKELIIVNGRNLYPHDLDKHLHDNGILELGKIACVRIAGDEGHSEGFVVFLASRNDHELHAELSRNVFRTISEDYGIAPLAVISIPSIPKTTSGKIKRVELETRYKSGEFIDQPAPKPKEESKKPAHWYSDTERKLLSAMQKLLEFRPIDVNDNFMELGIESIMLAQFHAFIEEQYPNIIHVMDLYERPKISALAEIIDHRLQQRAGAA